MNTPSPSRWVELFDHAMSLIDLVNADFTVLDRFTFGGGTALMLHLDHRESHDIDLFIDDPQILAYLNPIRDSLALSDRPTDYETDGAHFLKLVFGGVGEVDFICASAITPDPVISAEIRGRRVDLERPEEIICKKIHYRGGRIQPRDMFDLSAAVTVLGRERIVDSLAAWVGNCDSAAAAAERMDPLFARTAMEHLMIRPDWKALPGSARAVTIDTLRAAAERRRAV